MAIYRRASDGMVLPYRSARWYLRPLSRRRFAERVHCNARGGKETMIQAPAVAGIVCVTSRSGRHAVSEISRFFGIVISMYIREHGRPHFHVRYGEHWASIEVESELIRGYLPTRARQLVLEWTRLHRQELLANWHRARAELDLTPIAPLE